MGTEIVGYTNTAPDTATAGEHGTKGTAYSRGNEVKASAVQMGVENKNRALAEACRAVLTRAGSSMHGAGPAPWYQQQWECCGHSGQRGAWKPRRWCS